MNVEFSPRNLEMSDTVAAGLLDDAAERDGTITEFLKHWTSTEQAALDARLAKVLDSKEI